MSEKRLFLLYIVAGVLFIMALRGLSHPTTARQGPYGMVGMAIAITTLKIGHRPPASARGSSCSSPSASAAARRRRGDRQRAFP